MLHADETRAQAAASAPAPGSVERSAILERIERYRRRTTCRARQRTLYLAAGSCVLGCAVGVALGGGAALAGPRLAAALAGGLVIAGGLALLTPRPTRAAVAADLDRRLALADRLKTVVGVSRPSPLAVYLLHETTLRFSPAALEAALPRVVPRQALFAAGAALVAVLVFALVGGRPPVVPVVETVAEHPPAIEPAPSAAPAASSAVAAGPPERTPERRAPEASSRAEPPRAGREVSRAPRIAAERPPAPGSFAPAGTSLPGGQEGGAKGGGSAPGLGSVEPRELFAPRPEALARPEASFTLDLAAGADPQRPAAPGGERGRPGGSPPADEPDVDLSLGRRQAVDATVWRARIPSEYQDVVERFFRR